MALSVDALARVWSPGTGRCWRARSRGRIQSPDHEAMGQSLITRLLPRTGGATRIGITGVPASARAPSSKRSALFSQRQGIAWRAVDRSVQRAHRRQHPRRQGAMMMLSADANAFIRPSPSGSVLGGIARKTREPCCCARRGLRHRADRDGGCRPVGGGGRLDDGHAAGADAGRGRDELQGIKRGLLTADMIVVTKADGAM